MGSSSVLLHCRDLVLNAGPPSDDATMKSSVTPKAVIEPTWAVAASHLKSNDERFESSFDASQRDQRIKTDDDSVIDALNSAHETKHTIVDSRIDRLTSENLQRLLEILVFMAISTMLMRRFKLSQLNTVADTTALLSRTRTSHSVTSQNASIQIFAKGLGKTVTVAVCLSDTIQEVKAKIAWKSRIAVDRIMLRRIQLDDSATVDECNIGKSSTLVVASPRLRDGMESMNIPEGVAGGLSSEREAKIREALFDALTSFVDSELLSDSLRLSADTWLEIAGKGVEAQAELCKKSNIVPLMIPTGQAA